MIQPTDEYRKIVNEYIEKNDLTPARIVDKWRRGIGLVRRVMAGRRADGKPISRGSIETVIEFADVLGMTPVDKARLLQAAAGIEENEEVLSYRKLLSNSTYIENAEKRSDVKKQMARELIGHRIMEDARNSNLLLDSGSSTTEVAKAMIDLQFFCQLVYTNNFVAAFHLVQNRRQCVLIGGSLNGNRDASAYGALVGDTASMTVTSLDYTPVTIVTATAVTLDAGVHSHSSDNNKYKRELLAKAYRERSRIIILCDYTKLIDRSVLNRPIDYRGASISWQDLLDYEECFLVVGGYPSEKDVADRIEIILDQFRAAMGQSPSGINRVVRLAALGPGKMDDSAETDRADQAAASE